MDFVILKTLRNRHLQVQPNGKRGKMLEAYTGGFTTDIPYT